MESQLEVAALNELGVEHLVHQSRELLGPRQNDGRQLALVARCGGCGQQTGRSDDRVQLVAQLVAEVCEHLVVERMRPGSWAFAVAHLREACRGWFWGGDEHRLWELDAVGTE